MYIPPLIALEPLTLKSGRFVVRGEVFDGTYNEAFKLRAEGRAIFEQDLPPIGFNSIGPTAYLRRDLRAEP